jgi:hypothetical protein
MIRLPPEQNELPAARGARPGKIKPDGPVTIVTDNCIRFPQPLEG